METEIPQNNQRGSQSVRCTTLPSKDARPWYQFAIHDLLISICIVAITLVVVPLAPCFGVTVAGISLFGVYAVPRLTHVRHSLTLMLALLAVLVPVEFGCGLLAYHTLGEIPAAFVRMSVILNLVFVATFAMGSRRAAIIGILVFATWIVPYQLTLGSRWWLIHQESTAIIDFAERHRIEKGEFPIDLATYEFRHSSIKRHIRYRHESATFRVSYHIGTTGTSHWYDHGEQWEYYPD